MDFSTFQKLADKVPSLTGRHSGILYGLIKWLKPKTVVEIGSWQGGSAVWIARALQENQNGGKLFCIDDFSFEDASKNLLEGHLISCGVDEEVIILEGKSESVAWPESVDLAFIDGDHSLEKCQEDVERAMQRGAKCIVVHDTTSWWGPRAWLENFRKAEPQWGVLEVTFDEGLAIALKNPSVKPEASYHEGGALGCTIG